MDQQVFKNAPINDTFVKQGPVVVTFSEGAILEMLAKIDRSRVPIVITQAFFHCDPALQLEIMTSLALNYAYQAHEKENDRKKDETS